MSDVMAAQPGDLVALWFSTDTTVSQPTLARVISVTVLEGQGPPAGVVLFPFLPDEDVSS